VYPNPFTTVVSVKWLGISEANLKVCPTIQIYNLSGRLVKTLIPNLLSLIPVVSWDASQSPAGIYFVRLTAGDWSTTKKLILIK